MTARLHFGLVVLAACGHPPKPPPLPAAEDAVAILASEIAGNSARLVAIDEHGDRRFVAVAEATPPALDTNPAVSPDGRWVVFESSRGLTGSARNLWIAKVGIEQVPARLTTGVWNDAHPTWTPDGKAIVFASTREGGDFDLWRLPIAAGVAGTAVELTSDPRQEVTPTVARDGTLFYTLADRNAETGGIDSAILARAPDGTETQIAAGSSPALSPDGTQLAFSKDNELWILRLADRASRRLIELAPSDEGGPVWSRDGRFLFATSVLRGDAGAVFSSVIHVDLAEQPLRARMLEDHAGGIKRLTPAIVSAKLDAAALRSDPEYLPELARIMSEAIERAKEQQP